MHPYITPLAFQVDIPRVPFRHCSSQNPVDGDLCSIRQGHRNGGWDPTIRCRQPADLHVFFLTQMLGKLFFFLFYCMLFVFFFWCDCKVDQELFMDWLWWLNGRFASFSSQSFVSLLGAWSVILGSWSNDRVFSVFCLSLSLSFSLVYRFICCLPLCVFSLWNIFTPTSNSDSFAWSFVNYTCKA